jgi:hypothetical protein
VSKERPTIEFKGKGFKLKIPLGDGPITPTAGGPEIEELKRPGRPNITRNENQALLRLDVPVFFDGLPKNEAQNVAVKRVVDLAMELPLRDFTAFGPFLWSGGRFVMDWPEWGKQWYPRRYELMQAELTLKLVEFNASGDLKPQRGSGGPKKHGLETVILYKPMNLIEIAALYEGDAGRAKALGKANGIHDIKKKLPQGTHIKLPSTE